jgi:hypothetical protein
MVRVKAACFFAGWTGLLRTAVVGVAAFVLLIGLQFVVTWSSARPE